MCNGAKALIRHKSTETQGYKVKKVRRVNSLTHSHRNVSYYDNPDGARKSVSSKVRPINSARKTSEKKSSMPLKRRSHHSCMNTNATRPALKKAIVIATIIDQGLGRCKKCTPAVTMVRMNSAIATVQRVLSVEI